MENPTQPIFGGSSADQSPWKTRCHRQRPPRLYLSEKNKLVPSSKADVVLKGLAPQMWKVNGEKLSFSGNSWKTLKSTGYHCLWKPHFPLKISTILNLLKCLHSCIFLIRPLPGLPMMADSSDMRYSYLWCLGIKQAAMSCHEVLGFPVHGWRKNHNILHSRSPYNHRPGFWTLIK